VTILLLARHAAHRLIDSVLLGRTADVRLGRNGQDQARRLADHLAADGISAVQSSPQVRARETAAPIAARAGVPVEAVAAVDEIDVGDWSGLPFTVLRDDPLWQLWNRKRGSVRPPRGETMMQLQERVIGHLRQLSHMRPDERIVVVSHAEPIRAVLLHALDLPLDEFWRVELAPASVSTLLLEQGCVEVLAVNEAVPA
jgi:broad specificity phosphatase PhoE